MLTVYGVLISTGAYCAVPCHRAGIGVNSEKTTVRTAAVGWGAEGREGKWDNPDNDKAGSMTAAFYGYIGIPNLLSTHLRSY